MTDREPAVFIVDDDPSVCDAVQLLLRSVGIVSETFPSAYDFLEVYDPGRPGCLVLDVRMPGMSGLELQAHLRESGSLLPIIFITGHGDVPMAVNAVRMGALDFIEKPFRDQELLDKIQEALEENARDRAVQADRAQIQARIDSLTSREMEVLKLIVAGKPNKNIARALGISQRTVEIHRARVMEKMKARSVSGLVQLILTVPEAPGPVASGGEERDQEG